MRPHPSWRSTKPHIRHTGGGAGRREAAEPRDDRSADQGRCNAGQKANMCVSARSTLLAPVHKMPTRRKSRSLTLRKSARPAGPCTRPASLSGTAHEIVASCEGTPGTGATRSRHSGEVAVCELANPRAPTKAISNSHGSPLTLPNKLSKQGLEPKDCSKGGNSQISCICVASQVGVFSCICAASQ